MNVSPSAFSSLGYSQPAKKNQPGSLQARRAQTLLTHQNEGLDALTQTVPEGR